jgi:hypothetical protein
MFSPAVLLDDERNHQTVGLHGEGGVLNEMGFGSNGVSTRTITMTKMFPSGFSVSKIAVALMVSMRASPISIFENLFQRIQYYHNHAEVPIMKEH